MNRLHWLLALGAVLLAACGSEGEDASMAGMTAEEHARMQAGGTQGEMDSTGAAVRQAVHISEEEARAIGVRYATVRRHTLMRSIRTVGLVEAAEPRITDITPKIDGFVEQLFVTYTGEAVRRGQRLLTLYSPLMVAAQEELLTAKRMLDQISPESAEAWRNAQSTLAAARRRLEYWDITAEQIRRIEESGEATKTLTLVAPFNGIVLEKHVFEGQRVMEGMRLYRLADLSQVWIEGEVFEQDLQFVREGTPAHIVVEAYPGEDIRGRVSFVYPTVDPKTRTNRVRVSVPNPNLRLKPGMFATTFFDVLIGRDVLAIPMEAVVATGTRNLVFVRDADGMLGPREIALGARSGPLVHVLDGLAEGETIVASGNFLIDAESRLASAGGAMQHAGHGTAVQPDTSEQEHRQHD